ncbi:MAG: hypothetical protein KatS3mg014_1420 [Actinomycetota bacterium]|nr:MAG: hypothetical protein KatS3mg014_1420 [Actinomycetota bacterium]
MSASTVFWEPHRYGTQGTISSMILRSSAAQHALYSGPNGFATQASMSASTFGSGFFPLSVAAFQAS